MTADVYRPPLALGVILLAAGASTRMGRPKLLLPWGKRTVLGHVLEQWNRLGARQVAVVHAGAGNPVEAELNRLGVRASSRIVNPAPERGMFSSIQCAAAWPGWAPQLTHWAVALGDQPQVRLETLRRLVEFGAEHPGNVCQPSWTGKARHPVLIPKETFDRLPGARESSLREFLRTVSGIVALCEIDDPGLGVDLDTPADYEKLRRDLRSEI